VADELAGEVAAVQEGSVADQQGDASLNWVDPGGAGAEGGGQVVLGELVAGGGEADLESLGFAGPAFAPGFGDAGQEVVADAFQAAALGGVDPQEGGTLMQECSWMQLVG
jgi:hypothetical protein